MSAVRLGIEAAGAEDTGVVHAAGPAAVHNLVLEEHMATDIPTRVLLHCGLLARVTPRQAQPHCGLQLRLHLLVEAKLGTLRQVGNEHIQQWRDCVCWGQCERRGH